VKVTVLSVGRLRPPWTDDVAHYEKLLGRHCRLELVELREPAAHLRTFGHLQDFAGGILDSRPIVLYGTGTLLCLGLAVLAVEGQE